MKSSRLQKLKSQLHLGMNLIGILAKSPNRTRILRNSLSPHVPNEKNAIVENLPIALSATEKEIAYTFHVFYDDALSQVEQFLLTNPLLVKSSLYASASNPRIVRKLRELMDSFGIVGRVVEVPNQGRNFAPLLVEFRDELLEHNLVIHLHSKKSSHSAKNLGNEWGSRAWNLFANDVSLAFRVKGIFDSFPSIGLIYPYVGDIIKPLNFSWGLNFRPIQKFSRMWGISEALDSSGFLHFPAGGMFAVRTEAIKPILETEWDYSLFPKESGQLDGTLQHGIERAIGSVAGSRGFDHAVYDQKSDTFYLVKHHGRPVVEN